MKTKICISCQQTKGVILFANKGKSPHCKPCYNEKARQYRKENREKVLAIQRKSREKNLESRLEYSRRYSEQNKERIAEWAKIRNARPAVIEKRKKRRAERRKADLEYRLKENLRGRIYHALKRNSKTKSTIELVGCSIKELKDYLSRKFLPGMTWDNYGKWHVDHVKPCAAFDLSSPKEQKECFHYSNLQPLWDYDNWSKNKKVVTH
jgi:hypothetical protein